MNNGAVLYIIFQAYFDNPLVPVYGATCVNYTDTISSLVNVVNFVIDDRFKDLFAILNPVY